MKIKSLLKFLTTSLDSCIESLTFKQDASTLERNYSHLLEENPLKESESEFEWSPTGENITEATKSFYTILLPLEENISSVRYFICVPTKEGAIILRQNFNSNMVC
jgi:hypothetical protein